MRGERIRLIPYTDEHVAFNAQWLQDIEIQRLVNPGIVTLPTEQELSKPESWLSATRNNPDCFMWAIYTLAEDRCIGVGVLTVMDSVARYAELGINIGVRDYLGKGYGSEVMLAMINYGFQQLNLNRICLDVFGYNTRAIRLYEKLGFIREATEREALYRDDEYYDVIHMGLLRREWEMRDVRE